MKRIIFFVVIGATVAVTLIYSGITWAAETIRGRKYENQTRIMRDAEWAAIK